MTENGDTFPGLKLALNGSIFALVKLADYKEKTFSGLALIAHIDEPGEDIFFNTSTLQSAKGSDGISDISDSEVDDASDDGLEVTFDRSPSPTKPSDADFEVYSEKTVVLGINIPQKLRSIVCDMIYATKYLQQAVFHGKFCIQAHYGDAKALSQVSGRR